MDKIALKELAQQVLKDLDEYKRIRTITPENTPVHMTKKAIDLLIIELERDDEIMSERVLRAMQDIGGLSVKNFENTLLDDSIRKLYKQMWNTIPEFKELSPLRMDWGKGIPI
jgi:hypothetical protein